MLRYTVDQPTAILADANERSMFRIGIDTHNKFPEYENVLREESFGGTLDGEGNIASGGEWQAVGFNSTYLRHVNDIAKALSAGLSKHEKERGMVARAFQGAPTAPQVFDFSAWPGAILIVMPHHLPEFSREAAAILSPVTKGRIVALKAHATGCMPGKFGSSCRRFQIQDGPAFLLDSPERPFFVRGHAGPVP